MEVVTMSEKSGEVMVAAIMGLIALSVWIAWGVTVTSR